MTIDIKRIRRYWWFRWLIVGVVLRVIVMPITVHPDLWGQSIASYFFSTKGVINIYEYLASLPPSNALVQNFSVKYLYIYPPLTYFTQGFLNLLIRPLLNSNFFPSLITSPSTIGNFKGFLTQIFLLKFPYLFIDLLAAFMLAESFSRTDKKVKAFALWMINPLTIYATFMIGQNDILPVFFTILALFFISKRNLKWAVIALGIGGSYKLYPLLLIPPLIFYTSKTKLERIKLAILGVLPYAVTVIPFISSRAYREIVLLNPESTKILFMGLNVSGAESVYIFILFLVIIYFHSYYSFQKFHPNNYFLAILLIMFSVTHFHPQWFLWVAPFVIWQLVKSDYVYSTLVVSLLVSWLVITLMFEPSLSYGMFYPVAASVKNTIGLSELISRYYDPFVVKSVVRSVFAGTSVYYLFSIFTDLEAKNS